MARLKEAKQFHRALLNNDAARNYLYGRDITDLSISEFMLGLCSPHIDHWAKGRIVFPVFDSYNRFLDFGSRKITKPGQKGEWRNGNFAHTTIGETEKGHHLYNFNMAKKYILERQYAIITEGYFDVITSWQNGIKNVVATCGTSFTPTHLCLLMRYCEFLIFAYDADSAGQIASLRAANTVGDSVGIHFLGLPAGYDVDDYIREYGPTEFKSLVDQTIKDSV